MSWPLRLGRRARTCASNSSSRRRGRPPSTSTSASTTGPPPTDEDVAQDDNSSSNNNNIYRLHLPLRQRHLKSPTEQKVCCVSPFFVEVGRVVSLPPAATPYPPGFRCHFSFLFPPPRSALLPPWTTSIVGPPPLFPSFWPFPPSSSSSSSFFPSSLYIYLTLIVPPSPPSPSPLSPKSIPFSVGLSLESKAVNSPFPVGGGGRGGRRIL